MKRVAILGSTGSIGTQTLQVIKNNSDNLTVASLVAYSNEEKLLKQSNEFNCPYSALISQKGKNCLIDAVKNCDVAVIATKGVAALNAVLYCLENGIDVALANKETLVCAGDLVISKIGESKLYPIDSEHNAISQCMLGHNKDKIDKILLTASGGPFFYMPKEQLRNVTAADALKHPNWNMGRKITVDSATMANKALEVMEAKWLFGVAAKDIQIVVHRQSIVHSMIQFTDGGVIAQMAAPDMRLPIQTALLGEDGSYCVNKLNFADRLDLSFEKCDFDKFPCAKLGYDLEEFPMLCATVMNAANDECVESFLKNELLFTQFYNIIIRTVYHFSEIVKNEELTVANIEKFDSSAREYAKILIDEA